MSVPPLCGASLGTGGVAMGAHDVSSAIASAIRSVRVTFEA